MFSRPISLLTLIKLCRSSSEVPETTSARDSPVINSNAVIDGDDIPYICELLSLFVCSKSAMYIFSAAIDAPIVAAVKDLRIPPLMPTAGTFIHVLFHLYAIHLPFFSFLLDMAFMAVRLTRTTAYIATKQMMKT